MTCLRRAKCPGVGVRCLGDTGREHQPEASARAPPDLADASVWWERAPAHGKLLGGRRLLPFVDDRPVSLPVSLTKKGGSHLTNRRNGRPLRWWSERVPSIDLVRASSPALAILLLVGSVVAAEEPVR